MPNTPEPCLRCKHLYADCMQKDNPDYSAECKLGLEMEKDDCPKLEIPWTRESWDEACGFGEDERYLVDAIKRFLRTEEQKQYLYEKDLTIADLLNGNHLADMTDELIEKFFKPWNDILGWKHFMEDNPF